MGEDVEALDLLGSGGPEGGLEGGAVGLEGAVVWREVVGRGIGLVGVFGHGWMLAGVGGG